MRRSATALLLCLLAAPIVGAGPYYDLKATHSGAVDPLGADMWITFDRAVAGTYETEGGAYELTVNGSPTRVTDGTWPDGLSGSQGYGWEFDGSNDYLSRSDDGTFDCTSGCSIMVVATSHDTTINRYLVSKTETIGNQRGWVVYQNNSGLLVFCVSSDGSSYTCHYGAVGDFVTGQKTCAVITLDTSGGAGSTVASLYVNESTADVKSDLSPPFDGTGDFEVGSQNGGTGTFDGVIHYGAYVDGVVWTEPQARKLCRQYQGRLTTTGTAVTVSSASPPAIPLAPPDSGTEPFLVDMPADSAMVGSPASGSGGLYAAAAIDNLVQRSSFETWAGAGDATGWNNVAAAGDGSADISEDTTTSVHGESSVKIVLTGTTSVGANYSTCMTDGIGSDIYISAWAKKSAGTSDFRIKILEYDAADCTSFLQSDNIRTGDITTNWVKYGGKYASGDWHADTSSYKIDVREEGDGGVTTYIDAVQARVASTSTDAFCGCDTDATCSCDDVLLSVDQPLSTNGAVQVDLVVRSPTDGAEATPVRRALWADGTGGGDENALDVYWSQDYWTGGQHQSGGDLAGGGVEAAGDANTDYDVSIYHHASGRTGACWDGTCVDAWLTLRDAIDGTLYLGGSDTAGGDVWMRDVEFHRCTLHAAPSGQVLLYSDQSTPGNFELEIECPAGKSLTVYWGDGTSDAWVCDGTRNAVTHTYTTAGQYPVSVVGDVYDITEIMCTEAEAYGDIEAFSGHTSLTYLRLSNTGVSGDLSSISGHTSLARLYLYGSDVDDYTSTALPAWAGCDIRVQDLGLSSTEVDDFLIDLADGVGAGGDINIAGTNAARTAASDAAKTALIAAGWGVTVNE